jgi:hypothetical protein
MLTEDNVIPYLFIFVMSLFFTIMAFVFQNKLNRLDESIGRILILQNHANNVRKK